MEKNRWLDPQGLQDEYKISMSTQAKMRMRGSIPYSKIGTKFIRYDRQQIDRWLESNAVIAAGAKQ